MFMQNRTVINQPSGGWTSMKKESHFYIGSEIIVRSES